MDTRDRQTGFGKIEWPTVFLWLGCWGSWGMCLFLLPPFLAWGLLIFTLVLQSSLSHEALHGHPFPVPWINDLIALFSLGIFIPYLRFRDTHLAHHKDERLTDPYDDPESNFFDPAVWNGLSKITQILLRINNTLLGRMLIGPAISQLRFMWGDGREILAGHRRIILAWGLHLITSLIILTLIHYSCMSSAHMRLMQPPLE